MKPRENKFFKALLAFTKTDQLRNFIAFFALFISLLTLIYTTKKIDYDLRPILTISIRGSQSYKGYYGLILQNVGLGPAKITGVSLTYNGEQPSTRAKLERMINTDVIASNIGTIISHTEPVEPGMMLGTGQELIVYAVEQEKLDNPSAFDSILGKSKLVVEYSSINDSRSQVEFPLNTHP